MRNEQVKGTKKLLQGREKEGKIIIIIKKAICKTEILLQIENGSMVWIELLRLNGS